MHSDGRLKVSNLVQILVRRRKMIALTVGGCLLAASIATCFLPTWYESNVNLRVKYSRSLNDGIETLSQEEVMHQQIYTYAEVLKGKTVVQAAIAKVYSDVPEAERPDYENVSKRIEAVPLKNAEMLTISVQGKTPEEAQALANALVDTLFFQARIDAVIEPMNVQIVNPPDLPVKASKPNKWLNLAMGFLGGLFAGIAAAFLTEVFGKTIDTTAEGAAYLGLPVLGAIPEPVTRQGKGA